MLLVDRSFMVSILLCPPQRKHGRWCSKVDPIEVERNCVTLLCTINRNHDRVLDYFVVPRMTGYTCVHRNDSWIRKGIRLHRLSAFDSTVKKIWRERPDKRNVLKYLRSLQQPRSHSALESALGSGFGFTHMSSPLFGFCNEASKVNRGVGRYPILSLGGNLLWQCGVERESRARFQPR